MSTHLTQLQIRTIYAKQADLNLTMGGVTWMENSEKENPFMVATIVELIETVQHLNYKWWVKSEDDIAQAQMEVIDMLHFISSFGIRKLGSIDAAAAHMVEAQTLNESANKHTWDAVFTDLNIRPKYVAGVVESKWHKFMQLNQSCLNCIQEKKSTKMKGSFNVSYLSLCGDLLDLAEYLELPTQEIYTRYIGKHALNSFRQAKGSKKYGVTNKQIEYRALQDPKPYLKIWSGQEDNEYLHKYLQFNPEATEENIQQFLETEYAKHI